MPGKSCLLAYDERSFLSHFCFKDSDHKDVFFKAIPQIEEMT